jgi:transcriptional regulator with XRE-family HTH domain
MMDLAEKIKQIISDKNLTPSLFADEIGIQRSSVSHILAGRNRPSLDIVQKIVKRFPDLGLHWILDDQPLPEVIDFTPKASTAMRKEVASQSVAPAKEQLPPQQVGIAVPEKRVERIVIFYSDGTYKELKEV